MSEKKFIGHIGRTVMDTDYKYEVTEKHPENSPNVLYILLDDLGFSNLGCYGSNIDTPNIDRLAEEGLRYNNFHTTAICSATRASLLTGANHHAVGINALVETATGCPNGIGHINSNYGTIAEILREHEYSTFAAGKWHLANANETTSAGPFDNWPLGKGFEKYYGFLQGQMDQWNPILARDNGLVEKPDIGEEYHLSVDITNNAIDFISTQKNAYPSKPFFLYIAYGAMHSPHHAPREYINRYKGRFDEGWDKIREKWFENQKRLGVIPEDAELTERNEYVKAWDDLNDNQKKLFSRYMEAFGGFLEHTDEQIGRIIDYLRDINQLDNTIVVFLSDNGSSAEGGQEGRYNIFKGMDITSLSNEVEIGIENFDKIGTEDALNHYPIGWAHAGNTPFPWYKTYVHSGGVKDPLIIRYPREIKIPNEVRGQYHHVSDITPTVLDIIGIKKPKYIKGISQKEFQGTSIKYTFNNKEAKNKKRVQYYEILGNRGIWKDGWKAVVNHTFSETYADDVWELYHTENDYSEAHNVAEKYPEKLRELQDEFLIEAGKNGVFPLLPGSFHASADKLESFLKKYRIIPEVHREYNHIYKSFDLVDAISIDKNSFTIKADIFREDKNVDGVIFTNGDRFGGFVLYVYENKLKYVFNYQNEKRFVITSNKDLSVGKVTAELRFKFISYSKEKAPYAIATLYQNGENIGEIVVDKFNYMTGIRTTIGANKYTPVATDYKVPFEFKGKIEKLQIHAAASTVSTEEEIAKFFGED